METKPSLKLWSVFCFSAAIGFFFGISPQNTSGRYCGAPPKNLAAAALSEEASQKAADIRLPIAVYHSVRPYIKGESAYQDRYDITPELFRKHLQFLKENGFTTVSFSRFADYLDGKADLPEKPVILSFDDSWKNQYEYAFPLLKEFGFTGTFFVFTNSLSRGNHLSWEDARTLLASGMEIGSHTKTHPYLDDVKDEETLQKEIAGSKQILEESLGVPIEAFAYPFGEHGATTVAEVKRAGYRTARSLAAGEMQGENNRYVLGAFLTTDNFDDFTRKLKD